MDVDDLFNRVLSALQNNPASVAAVNEAIASGDRDAIRRAISESAGISVTDREAQLIADRVRGGAFPG